MCHKEHVLHPSLYLLAPSGHILLPLRTLTPRLLEIPFHPLFLCLSHLLTYLIDSIQHPGLEAGDLDGFLPKSRGAAASAASILLVLFFLLATVYLSYRSLCIQSFSSGCIDLHFYSNNQRFLVANNSDVVLNLRQGFKERQYFQDLIFYSISFFLQTDILADTAALLAFR